MKIFYALAVILSASVFPAIAQPAANASVSGMPIAKGAMIFTADGRRVGRVDHVRSDSVSLIYNSRFIEIPLNTLTPTDKGYATSINKVDLTKL